MNFDFVEAAIQSISGRVRQQRNWHTNKSSRRCELHCLKALQVQNILLSALVGSLLFLPSLLLAQLRLYSGSCWHEL